MDPAATPDLSKVPLAANPNGGGPNFIDPPDAFTPIIAVGTTFGAIALTLVCLRVFVKSKSKRGFELDDYLCFIAFALTTAQFGINLSFRTQTRHIWDVPVSSVTISYVKRQFAYNVMLGPSRWFIKATILTLYLRIFHPQRWLRYTVYATLAISFPYFWSMIPIAGVFCAPKPGSPWTLDAVVSCGRITWTGPMQAGGGTVVDIIILLMPLPIIRSLHMSGHRKLGLFVVFTAAILALTASVIALYYAVKSTTDMDTTWNGGILMAAVLAEHYITLAVSCAPAFSSFCTNHFLGSPLHASLSSLPRILRNPRSYPGAGSDASGSTSSLARYRKASDGDSVGFHSSIHGENLSTRDELHLKPYQGGIQKQTTIEQTSQSRGA